MIAVQEVALSTDVGLIYLPATDIRKMNIAKSSKKSQKYIFFMLL